MSISEKKTPKFDIPKTYRQWILASRPKGAVAEDDIKLVVVNMVENLEKGQMIVAIKYLSVDPYMRGTMNETSYGRTVPLNSTMIGAAVGTVVQSENANFKVADTVYGYFGWTEYAISSGTGVKKIPPEFQLSYSLGALGMPGATAYHGFFDICLPKAGDTIFVTGAAGAVGTLVGQLAKLASCTVIGSVGSQEKAKLCTSLGYDAVIVYKDKEFSQLSTELKSIAPSGIDCFFDNTGGLMSDVVFQHLNQFARVSICGQIANYNNKDDMVLGRPILADVLRKQIKVEGFVVSRWNDWSVAHSRIFEFIQAGKIVVKEDIVEGFDKMRDAFLGLFSGKNIGKCIVKI